MKKVNKLTVVTFILLFLVISGGAVYACEQIITQREEKVKEHKKKIKRPSYPVSAPVYVPPTEVSEREPVDVPTEAPVMPPSQGKNG